MLHELEIKDCVGFIDIEGSIRPGIKAAHKSQEGVFFHFSSGRNFIYHEGLNDLEEAARMHGWSVSKVEEESVLDPGIDILYGMPAGDDDSPETKPGRGEMYGSIDNPIRSKC